MRAFAPVAAVVLLTTIPAPALADSGFVACTATADDVELTRLEAAMGRVRDELPKVGVSLVGDDWTCSVRAERMVVSASTVKPILVAALFNRRWRAGRRPSVAELGLARASIRRSDNGATTALWRRTGAHRGLRVFARRADLRIVPGYGTRWGGTWLSAVTLSSFAGLLLHPDGPVTSTAARFVLANMRRVVPEQRWGVTAAAPPGAVIALKNGWRPSYEQGFVAHSYGVIRDSRRTYVLAVTSTGSSRYGAAVARVQRAAALVNRAVRATAVSDA